MPLANLPRKSSFGLPGISESHRLNTALRSKVPSAKAGVYKYIYVNKVISMSLLIDFCEIGRETHRASSLACTRMFFVLVRVEIIQNTNGNGVL